MPETPPAMAAILGEGAGLSVAVVDERGRIVFASAGFALMIGRRAAEILGRAYLEVIPQTEVAEARTIHDAIVAGTPEVARVVERVGQDGSRRLLLSRSTRYVDPADAVWRIVNLTDVTELRSLEQRADKARSLLERYFDEAPDCFFIIRVEENGGFVYEAQNSRSEAATGIPTADFIGRTPTEIFSPETAAFVTRRYRECIEAGRTLQTVDHMVLHGRPTVWETVLIPVRDETGRVVRINGISREITDVVASRRKLLSTERLLASILDVSDFGIAVVGEDFRLRAANRTLALIFGTDRDAMTGRDIREIVDEQDRGRIEHMVTSLLRAPMTRRELRVRTGPALGDRERILFVSGTAVEGEDEPLVALTAADVTRPAELEAALRRQEDRLLRIADEMPSAVVVLDRELRYEFVNRTAVAWYARDRDHIVGRTIWEILGKERVSRILSELERTLAGETVEFDDHHVYGDGVERMVRLAYSPRREVDGRISGVYCFITDTTATRRAERDLRQAKEEAEAANRAKSQFLANMSHELRTPLNAIIGFSDLIMNETFGPIGSERYLEYARDIHTGGSHLLALINDMLDLARIEAGSYPIAPERLDLARVVHQATTLVRMAAESSGVDVSSCVAPGGCPVVADLRALRQMLVNLLSNAVKFTPPGGSVTISAERLGEATLIRVADTGEGIPAERLPVVTMPFASAHDVMTRARDGTGIGLSIVKSLIERHGGTIEIHSSIGEGTCVTLTLPDQHLSDDGP